MTKLRNTERLKNVKTTFQNMPDDVPKEGITYFKEDSKGSFNLLYDHIQGYTVNDSHAFFCVNQSSGENGSILVYDRKTLAYVKTIKTESGFNHPSGIQAIGDFLVFGLQTGDYQTNKVSCYSIDKDTTFDLNVPLGSQHTPSVGITDVNVKADGSFQYLLLAAGDGSATLFLSASTKTGLSEDLAFQRIQTFSGDDFPKLDAQGVQLLTQVDGSAFILSFTTEDTFFSYKDYINLFSITTPYDTHTTATLVESKHIVTEGPYSTVAVKLNPHCRWGTGMEVSNDALSCFVSGRQPTNVIDNNAGPILNTLTQKES